MGESKPPDGKKKAPRMGLAEMRLLAMVSSIGLAMALSIFFGAALGYYLDKWLGTKPWLFLAGILVGIAAAFNNLIIMTRRMERQRSKIYGKDGDGKGGGSGDGKGGGAGDSGSGSGGEDGGPGGEGGDDGGPGDSGSGSGSGSGGGSGGGSGSGYQDGGDDDRDPWEL
ncbi:MAG: AtpZ/AtpI family protein [Deltaproteobacteria bacterium]|nr:AtpZ/AtpI family protein [Deltaproteobacteria bacterium]